jgi:O-antigen/teichoic acid export membrane protein
MLVFGILASLIILIFGPIGIKYIKSASDHQDVLNSIWIISLSMPFILLTSGFRGILEAKYKFEVINLIRLPLGLFTFIGPTLVVIFIGPNLEIITAILVLIRILAFLVYGWFAWLAIHKEHGKFDFEISLIKSLFSKGGWMTISNVVSPLMGYVDRFFIGYSISASAITFYVTPQEIVTKLSIIPSSLTAVLFPAFASQISQGYTQTQRVFTFSVKLIFFVLLPVSTFLVFFSQEVMSAWINQSFSLNSEIFLKVFSIGILVNSITHIPFTLIQSAGLAKTTAKIHIIQFPIFIGLLWTLIHFYGILGAALAWLARMILDSILMFSACYKIMGWRWNGARDIRNLCYLLGLLMMILFFEIYGNLLLKLLLFLSILFYSLHKIIQKYFISKEFVI